MEEIKKTRNIQAGWSRMVGFQGRKYRACWIVVGSDPEEVSGRAMNTLGAAAAAKQVHSNLRSAPDSDEGEGGGLKTYHSQR